jgi:predicted DNA-binding transcriptional regulator AlpA
MKDLNQVFLTPTELAAYLHKSKSSIWRWIDKGIIPKPRKVTPQTLLWRKSDIDKALNLIDEDELAERGA